VWHASVAGQAVRAKRLRAEAVQALEGVGAAISGEWEEWTGKALHLRRRLAPAEAEMVGPVVDIRGTVDQLLRFHAMRQVLPPGVAERLGPN
jgi:hypothetical protein